MKFEKYYKQEILSEMAQIVKDWHTYVNRNPLLQKGVEVLNKLEKYGKAYIVGGAVRDIISGEKEPNDIDISTNVPMDKIESMFQTHNIGANKDFGIVVINYKGETFEIAQFREDGTYTNGRHPDKITVVASFEDDAKRRDFTLNAMAVDSDGNVIDYFDGKGDIKNKLIKAVGDPSKRFSEDSLRMLRAVRFSSRMGMDIEQSTAEAIKKHASDISKISPERITKELIQMAKQKGGKFADAIITLDKVGLLKYIMPEIYSMKSFEHNIEHHPEGGVYDHTLEALRASHSEDPIINLSILFHDVGKIKTYNKTEEGRISYIGHAGVGAEMIDDIAHRLRLDKKTTSAMKFSALNHMKMYGLTGMSNDKIIKLMNDPNWHVLLIVGEMEAKARGKLFSQNDWDEVTSKVNILAQQYADKGNDPLITIRKVINGKMVMDIKKISNPSKQVGDYIKTTVDWIVNNNIDIKDVTRIKKFIKNL